MNRWLCTLMLALLMMGGLIGCQSPVGHRPTQSPADGQAKILIAKPTTTRNPATIPFFSSSSTPLSQSNITPTPDFTRVVKSNPSAARSLVVYTRQVQSQAPQIYGVNGWWTDEDSAMWLERYAELNPGYVRLPLMGDILEPVNDDSDPTHINWPSYNFDSPYPVPHANGEVRNLTYGRWLAALKRLDIGIIVYIPYLPGWLSVDGNKGVLSTYPPNDMAEYRELVRAVLLYLVDEVGFAPEKIIFEPINEPDLPCSFGQAVSCFWTDSSTESLVAVISAAHTEAHLISPQIRIAGLSICCNYELLDSFLLQTAGEPLLDLLTYHVYTSDANLDPLLAPVSALERTGLPIILDEYGSMTYWSNGLEGALWHSIAIAYTWPSKIGLIQFVMAEMPGMHPGFNELGLFTDWTEGWERKPAYWVYSSFFRTFAGRDTLALESPRKGWDLAGYSPQDGSIALWLTNTDQQTQVNVRLEGWSGGAHLTSRDNLVSPPRGESTPTLIAAPPDGQPLVFEWTLPAYSSITLLIEPIQ